jgi:cation diffusion facilitator CzcD-associated flavoprotein CzcO
VLYQPFPSNWPEFTPRDMLGDWFESYAINQHIIHWTNSTVVGRPVYDAAKGKWDVTVDRNGILTPLHPSHIIFATGTLASPKIPELPGRAEFTGRVFHSDDFTNAVPFVGKRVAVIGAGNSSIDICQDLVLGGAASVTMVQRSSTCVVSRSIVREHVYANWKPGAPVEIGDFKAAAMPVGLLRQIMIASQDAQWAEEKVLHAKLRKGGVSLTLGPDGEGHLILVYERCGGYCEPALEPSPA